MFNIKDFIEEQSESANDWEIDLSPLLALMVTLIPVLLLQTSFVTLKMLETTLPILSDVKQEDKKDRDKNEINFDLGIFAKNENDFVLNLTVNEKLVKKIDIKAKGKNFDLDKLKEELVKIKKDYPKEMSAKLTPDEKVQYDVIVKMLDVIRENSSGEMIRFVDKNGTKVETALLFPDVVFGNIAE